jgi:FlaA1/EpsC-like NDP-sugar epimerase
MKMKVRRFANLSMVLLQRRTWFTALFQALLVFGALQLAWLLRFDFHFPEPRLLFTAAFVLVAIRILTFAKFNLLHGWWQYTGISDATDIAKAIGVGSVAFWAISYLLPFMRGFPRSVFVTEAILSGASLGGIRLLSRAVAESVRRDRDWQKRILLIGAGFAAQMIIRELGRPGSECYVVGCLDDDASKRGINIHRVPVLGAVGELSDLLRSHLVDEVIIAVPSATNAQMQRFVTICQEAGVKFKTVPALKDLIAGQLDVNQIRDVRLEDLLGREAAQLDLASVRRQIAGRRVLVTGAAGSIGAELCRQLLDYNPAHLVCLDQSETGMFFLDRDLEPLRKGCELSFCVADVGDQERMHKVFSQYRPEITFHAAAYKHVPMMEANVQEAVKNNVFGLLTTLNVAEEVGCRHFVLISSDKAVNPTNIMGATKRLCELILSSKPPNGMTCVSVRFGNVLGSSGSVVPVLKDQISNNRPLTITHPDIKRFFMTIHEAVGLVLQAFTIGSHGDILVLDMGEPVRILDLARSLIRLSGKSEHEIEIKFTGLRPGEKFEEELFYKNERVVPTTCDKIKRTQGALRNWSDLHGQLDELRASMVVDGARPVRTKVCEIIPECSFDRDLSEPRSNDSEDSQARSLQSLRAVANQGSISPGLE